MMPTSKIPAEEEAEFLSAMQRTLEEEEVTCTFKQGKGLEGHMVAALYVPVLEEGPVAALMEIRAQKQVSLQKQESVALMAVQFLVHIETEVKAEYVGDVAFFIATVNRLLPLPGFELDMAFNKVYYRYVLYNSATAALDKQVVKSLVGAIFGIVRLYIQALHSLATGAKRYHELMEDSS